MPSVNCHLHVLLCTEPHQSCPTRASASDSGFPRHSPLRFRLPKSWARCPAVLGCPSCPEEPNCRGSCYFERLEGRNGTRLPHGNTPKYAWHTTSVAGAKALDSKMDSAGQWTCALCHSGHRGRRSTGMDRPNPCTTVNVRVSVSAVFGTFCYKHQDEAGLLYLGSTSCHEMSHGAVICFLAVGTSQTGRPNPKRSGV